MFAPVRHNVRGLSYGYLNCHWVEDIANPSILWQVATDEMKMYACMPLLLYKSLGETRDQNQNTLNQNSTIHLKAWWKACCHSRGNVDSPMCPSARTQMQNACYGCLGRCTSGHLYTAPLTRSRVVLNANTWILCAALCFDTLHSGTTNMQYF